HFDDPRQGHCARIRLPARTVARRLAPLIPQDALRATRLCPIGCAFHSGNTSAAAQTTRLPAVLRTAVFRRCLWGETLGHQSHSLAAGVGSAGALLIVVPIV